MTAPPALPPHGELLRRFAVDWLARADPSVPARIMAADYRVSVGGHELTGVADYVAATVAQLERFPGLLITVHDTFGCAERVALRFTLHGPSAEHARPVAWRGIALFAVADGLLARSVVEEDYLARRRQLADGTCDPVDPPAPAPWASPDLAPEPNAVPAVRAWLAAGDLTAGHVELDDGSTGQATPRLLDGPCELVQAFAAGSAVAFQAVQTGAYLGGLPGAEAALGVEASMSMVGVVRTGPDGIRGHVVRDRLGTLRRLRAAGGTP